MAAIGPNTATLQFDWFISGRIFPVSPAQGGNLKTLCLCPIKIKFFDNIWSENVLQTIKKRKVTMQSEVSEKILYEMTTESQVFIWRSVPLHLSVILH